MAATSVIVASLLTGVPAIPGLPKPGTALATTTGPTRMCPGVQEAGYLVGSQDAVTYKIFVPSAATVSVTGAVDLLNNEGIAFYLDPLPSWFVGNPNQNAQQPNLPLAPAHSWTNNGTDADVTLSVHAGALRFHMNWRITATVTAGSGGPACAGLTAANSLGHTCAGTHVSDVQGQVGDPVNTATGNFHEDFQDFSVPARGPGLDLAHAYNSLQASTDGPLGFGWTFSDATSLSVSQPSGVATLTEEGGATVPFYPVPGGGYEAPAWALAALVHNPDGSYTLKRCNRSTFAFSASGQLTSVTDRNGYATTLAYTAGKLATVTDSAGHHLTFTWLGTHISSVADDTGRTVTYGYNDGAGNLTDYTDTGGATWAFTYAPATSHLLTAIRRPRQAGVQNPPVTTNAYDGSNRVTTQTDDLGRQTLIDYTAIPGSTKVTDPKGNVTVEAYQGYVRTALTRGYGTASASTWTFETDATLGVSKVTDPLGHSTASAYDPDGNLIYTRDALGYETFGTYNAFDEPLTVKDATGTITTFTYDPNGNLTSESTPVGSQTRLLQYGYDPAHPGDLTTVTDAAAKVWARTYDPSTGYLLTETDPLGDKTQYRYDTAKGWLLAAVSPRGSAAGVLATCTPPALGCTTYAHDAWGHVSVTTDPNGHATTDHYDADANLDYHVDADNNRTNYLYDAADQLTTIQRPDATTLVTHYWADGSVKDTVDGANHPTAYAYDSQARLVSITDPDNRTTAYGYDPDGNRVTQADPGGACPPWSPTTWPPAMATGAACTATAYDALDRPVSVTYSDGATPNVTSVSYDAVGRRTSLTQDHNGAASAWSWDSLGRLTSSTTGSSTVGYSYANTRDPATTITYPGNRSVVRAFDNARRLTSVQDWLGNVTSFTPDADSNTKTVTPPAATTLSDSFGFDNADQVSLATAKAGASTLASFGYGRDNANQLTSVSTSGTAGLSDTHSYTYSPLNQLKNLDGAGAWGNDAADNLTSMSGGTTMAAYDPANQLGSTTTAGASTTFSFDSRGNRTFASTSARRASTAYTYDQAGRLTSATPGYAFDQLSAGWYHSLAARSDGTAWDWGYNAQGELGNNSTVDSHVPLTVPNLTGVVAVAAAAYESVALRADGTVWSWGWNSNGQLGDGTTTDRHAPVQVSGLANIVAVAAGTSHYLALRADGTVWAWGYNSNGQLGDGTITDRHAPVQVANLAGVVAIAGGYTYSVALRSDGTVWSWGYNGLGQLGNNSTVESHVPVQASGISGVVAIAAGYHHTLAAKGDGTVWAWGYNANGQLGDNTTTDHHLPTQVPGLGGGARVMAAGYSSMVARSDGTVAVWGYNANGNLGDGTTTERHTPETVAALGSPKALSPAPIHTLETMIDNTLHAWGDNSYGGLGDGTTTGRTSPVTAGGYTQGASPQWVYGYTGDGLRTTKAGGGLTTATFTWDQSGPVPLVLDDGTNAYLYGPDGSPFEQVGPAGAVSWLHHDQIGSTRVITNSTGAVTATATYDPYGRLTASTGIRSPLGFAGEYTDAETGFVYLRARYYDPATGQFVSRDPAYNLTLSRYGYADDDPLNEIDPSGLGAEQPKQLSAQEQAALDAHARGEKVNDKVYNRAKQKQIFNEKLAQERNKQKRQSNFSSPPSSVDVLGGRYPAVYDPNASAGRTPNVLGVIYTGLGYCLDALTKVIPPLPGPAPAPAPIPLLP